MQSFIKFYSLVLEMHLPQNFCLTDTQIDRHFPKIVKWCSGHPKTYKSIKNWKSEVCTKPMLFSTCAEESKNGIYSTYKQLKGEALLNHYG